MLWGNLFVVHGLELFTFVIKPNQCNDSAANTQSLRGAETAAAVYGGRRRGFSGCFRLGGFVLLFSIMTAYSAAAFFCPSRAARVLSATILPAATRFGFFASRVVGVCEVTFCVVSAAGVSGCCCSVDVVPMQMMRLTSISRLLVAQKLLKIVVHLFSSCCALLRNFFSLWLSSSRIKINVFCGCQSRVGQSEKSAVLQSKAARQVGELFADDVVLFQLSLESFDIFDRQHHTHRFRSKHQSTADQAVGRLCSHEGLVPLVVLFNVLVGKALHLLVC